MSVGTYPGEHSIVGKLGRRIELIDNVLSVRYWIQLSGNVVDRSPRELPCTFTVDFLANVNADEDAIYHMVRSVAESALRKLYHEERRPFVLFGEKIYDPKDHEWLARRVVCVLVRDITTGQREPVRFHVPMGPIRVASSAEEAASVPRRVECWPY